MNKEPDSKEMHRLFLAKADGTITDEEHARLSLMLHGSVSVRSAWFAFQDAEAALLAWAQRETLANHAAPGSVSSSGAPPALTRGGVLKFFGALAAGIAIGLVAWGVWAGLPVRFFHGESSAGANVESTTPSVAVLSRGVNMKWNQTTGAPAVNAPLSPGLLHLESGVAEIEFFQGARLCIEGPAEIELISAGEAFCRSGRFRAHVPPQARGFRLRTPKGDIVDLGTDFGLDLNQSSPEVHVFKGEVELHQPKVQMQTLIGGVAAALNQPGAARTLAANAANFAFSDLDAGVNASQRLSFEKWQATSAEGNQSADLRLRLDFQDGPGARSLRNTALHGQDIAAASIVGCSWTEGRWPGKHALQFKSLSDRVRLRVPGEYRQFTVACWVQLHGLNIRQGSICMSEGVDQGYVHWQVLHDGSLCLGIGHGVKPNQPVWEDFISPVVFTPERFGQWVHLAIVYDSAACEVRHYVDGKRISRHTIKLPVVLTPGLLELGNWNSPPKTEYRQQPVRNFIGCMDEFSIFSRAMTDVEVRALAQ